MPTQTEIDTQTPQSHSRTWNGFDRQFINGAWRRGRGSRPSQDQNPYTGETITAIQSADQSDIDDAYQSAANSQPSWAAALPLQRAEVMRACRLHHGRAPCRNRRVAHPAPGRVALSTAPPVRVYHSESTTPEHIEENAGAGDLVLSEVEIARIDKTFPLGPPPKELPVL